MNARSRVIETIEVTGNSEINTIEVQLTYNAGGLNYFTYKNEPRGYYLSVSPYKQSQEGHFQTKVYSGFSGIKSFVEEASRFGKKKLDNMMIDQAKKQELINHVLEKNNIAVESLVKAA